MDTTHVGGTRNNNSEMEDEIDNYTEDKVCVYETVISAGFINENVHDTDNKQRSILNHFTLKDENIVDGTAVDFIKEIPCGAEYKQGSIHDYVGIKDENIDDLTVVVPGTEFITDCIDNKMCLNETVISGGYIKQEPGGMKDEQRSIQNYVGIKDKNIDDLTVVVPGTDFITDCIDDKICLNETVISGGYIKQEPCGMKDDQRVIENSVSMKDENIDDLTVVVPGTEFITDCIDNKMCLNETVISGGYIKQEPGGMKDEQRSVQNYVGIKDKNIDDLTVVVPGTEFITDCIDDKICLNETVISGGYIKQEPCGMKDDQRVIENSVSMKDENIDDLTVVVPGTEFISDCIDDKICLNETVISGGSIKQEPCGRKDDQRVIENSISMKDENIDDLTVVVQKNELMTGYMDNKACVYETLISGGYIKQEPCHKENESGSFHNNVNMKGCEECGEEYDLYCLKCSMLIRVFNSNNPNRRNNRVRWTLPKNVIDVCETPSGVGIVALRTIPKGVVFGPFQGLDSTKDGTVSKWKLKNKELAYGKDPRWLNWMQYIKVADQNSHQNLVPFQYKGQLYYRSECHINVGDELLVCWDSDSKDSEDQEMEDSYWKPRVCESLDDSYACTFCCVGYKSINHLKVHNSTCIKKRNKKDFCGEIVRCDLCKIYLDKKEYRDYHVDRCYKSNGKCVFNSHSRTNREGPPRYRIPNGDRRFSCTLCPYKATTKSILKKHFAVHSDDRAFACTLCSYKANTNMILKRHIASHNNDRPFACTLCLYRATTKSILNRHIASHNNDRPFACTLCPYKAITKLMLKQHIAIHNNDRPFACSLCAYKATTKSILKQHVAVHSVGRHFACTLCPYKATTNSHLKQHIAIHNGGKPFACTLCLYKGATKTLLKQHIAIHKDGTPFACTLCPYKATTSLSLKRHVTTHNGDKLACTFCPYKATIRSNLRRHIANHTGDKPFACTLCPYKTTRESDLKKHIAVHNGDKPYACTFCPYKATIKGNLKKHIAVHNDDKPFACTFCPFKTTSRSILIRHIANHTGDKPFACTLCPYKTKRESDLKKHIAIHNGDKPFACTLCPYKTISRSILRRHIANHNGDKPFACTLCPYKTKREFDLKKHIAVHDGDKPFACTFCPYKTTSKSNLRRHIANHTGDKPFSCTLCPYKTTRESDLKKHIAVHNGDKPYTCTFCPYKATIKGNLKKHIALHKGDKPFACTLCPYKTTREFDLKKHIAVHNGDKPFACTVCSYKAKTNTNLKRHVVSHHN